MANLPFAETFGAKMFKHSSQTGMADSMQICCLADIFNKVRRNYFFLYKGESISNQPIPFPMDRDGHDFHALFQYMFLYVGTTSACLSSYSLIGY